MNTYGTLLKSELVRLTLMAKGYDLEGAEKIRAGAEHAPIRLLQKLAYKKSVDIVEKND